MPTAGRRIAERYELLDIVGSGGMATVWRARDLRLGRTVAVKLLRPQYAEDARFVERFQTEARHAASLAHPNIAPIFDTGADGDERYIVMEFVDGPSLAELLAERGRLDPLEAVTMVAAAARGLAAAHRRGIVHRDVKPGNLLLGRDGRLRVVDFGIARALTTAHVTATGMVLGSVPYLSPEQARGEEATAASDLFSLGIVLYEMLTGQVPWSSDTPGATALARLGETAPPPSAIVADLPPGLDAIVERALAPDPAERYPSARAFADAVEVWRRRWTSVASALPEASGGMAAAPSETPSGSRPTSPAEPVAPAEVVVPSVGTVARAVAQPNPGMILPTDEARDPDPPSPGGWPGRDGQVAAPAPTLAWRRVGDGPVGVPVSRPRHRRLGAPIAFLLVALLVGGTTFAQLADGFRSRGAVLEATATLQASLGTTATDEPTAFPTPDATLPPTAPPTLAPVTASPATAVVTPQPTARPTARPPTPAPVAASSPAGAVRAFYDAVEAHDFDRAASRWTAEMRRRYPPAQYIDGRFTPTTRIDLPRLQTVSQSGDTARVAVTIVEYRQDVSAPRRYTGAWDLVRRDGRWLLAEPDLTQVS